MLREALAAGVPQDRCLVQDSPTSTYTNFAYALPIIRRYHLRQVVVVTSWYHTRRSQWVAQYFAKGEPGLTFYVVPSDTLPSLTQRFEWQQLRRVGSEWAKMLWYGFHHGLFFSHG